LRPLLALLRRHRRRPQERDCQRCAAGAKWRTDRATRPPDHD